MAANAGVSWWMQLNALSRRSGHSRASRMALIRYFLLPSNAGVSTLNSLPFSFAAGPKDTSRRHIHTINTYGFFLCLEPLTSQGFLTPWQRPLWCKYSSRQTLYDLALLRLRRLFLHPAETFVFVPPCPIALFHFQADVTPPPPAPRPPPPPHFTHMPLSVSTPHYKSDGSLLRPIRLSEAAASVPVHGRPSLQQVLDEAKGRRAAVKWA